MISSGVCESESFLSLSNYLQSLLRYTYLRRSSNSSPPLSNPQRSPPHHPQIFPGYNTATLVPFLLSSVMSIFLRSPTGSPLTIRASFPTVFNAISPLQMIPACLRDILVSPFVISLRIMRIFLQSSTLFSPTLLTMVSTFVWIYSSRFSPLFRTIFFILDDYILELHLNPEEIFQFSPRSYHPLTLWSALSDTYFLLPSSGISIYSVYLLCLFLVHIRRHQDPHVWIFVVNLRHSHFLFLCANSSGALSAVSTIPLIRFTTIWSLRR